MIMNDLQLSNKAWLIWVWMNNQEPQEYHIEPLEC